jgi:hypothetical protein
LQTPGTYAPKDSGAGAEPAVKVERVMAIPLR